jgi:CheY-like chemotaxis protein
MALGGSRPNDTDTNKFRESATMTRTLIVDDEEDMRILLRSTIEAANNGLVVTGEAANGHEALQQWRETQPDVIVLDHRMPGLSGLETAGRILAEDPDQTIVLFSAHLSPETRQEAEKLGVRHCLLKDAIFELPDVLWAMEA